MNNNIVPLTDDQARKLRDIKENGSFEVNFNVFMKESDNLFFYKSKLISVSGLGEIYTVSILPLGITSLTSHFQRKQDKEIEDKRYKETLEVAKEANNKADTANNIASSSLKQSRCSKILAIISLFIAAISVGVAIYMYFNPITPS